MSAHGRTGAELGGEAPGSLGNTGREGERAIVGDPGGRTGAAPDDAPLEDLNRLYLEFASSLARLVRGGVHASDVVIEDACQAAWTRLVLHRHRITEQAARGWLTRTAVHEAVKLSRREVREPPSTPDDEHPPLAWLHPARPEPQQLLEQRQRLDSLRALSYRQQRLVWLGAIGVNRDEMARHERCTTRTVHRQLDRARRKLLSPDGGPAARAA